MELQPHQKMLISIVEVAEGAAATVLAFTGSVALHGLYHGVEGTFQEDVSAIDTIYYFAMTPVSVALSIIPYYAMRAAQGMADIERRAHR
jgi:hypothetical protein